ncbi:MAG: HU family DNA-binding protein [Eubacterium sp.]|nr:HU family DNA-binding protein [Eubacterium sp.]
MEEKTMNKTDLVAAVAAKAEISKKDAEAAVTAVFASITDALADGDKVALVGFGTFDVKERAARTGLNPRTKEKIQIPASKSPAFKAGKALKDAVK